MLEQLMNRLFQTNRLSVKLPEDGFIFITGYSGTGKSCLMQEVITEQKHRKFSIYGLDLDYQSKSSNSVRRHTIKHYSEKPNWFDIRDKLHEDVRTGRDIVFDDAQIFVNEESFDILKPVFSGVIKSRIFFITQQNFLDLLTSNNVLALFGGKEIQCYRTTKSGFQYAYSMGS